LIKVVSASILISLLDISGGLLPDIGRQDLNHSFLMDERRLAKIEISPKAWPGPPNHPKQEILEAI
jgi:hypothetical protein